MSRIEKTFENLRLKREKALICYLMAGDPNPKATEELVLTLEKSGADIVELGIPFSDPVADGPVIQQAAQRALDSGMNLKEVFRIVAGIRNRSQIPIILMSYLNPVFKYGEERFIRKAVSLGVDGVILVDLPPEEGNAFIKQAGKMGLDVILLAAPTSSRSRLKMIADLSGGFVYYVSITGITGAKLQGLNNIKSRVKEIRGLTRKPVAVGFGVSSPEQAAELSKTADGVVVGSAIVNEIATLKDHPDLHLNLGSFVRDLKDALSPAK